MDILGLLFILILIAAGTVIIPIIIACLPVVIPIAIGMIISLLCRGNKEEEEREQKSINDRVKRGTDY